MRNIKYDITFVIFTYNEEDRIERVISNFRSYGEVLLADDGSTDKTIEIAKRNDCIVFSRPKCEGFVEKEEMAQALYKVVKTSWIYWGFADEMLDRTALNKISEIIESGKYDIINIFRKNYFYGKYCQDAFSSRSNKIFKKGAIDFTNNPIHGFGKVAVGTNRIYKMESSIFVHHFISNCMTSYLNTINRYTQIEVKFSTGRENLFYGLFVLPIRLLISNYVIKGGYRAGFSGLSLSIIMIYYYITKYIKIRENSLGLTENIVEKENNLIRDDILKQLGNP